jgi:iron complex transport system ATP-binding protein
LYWRAAGDLAHVTKPVMVKEAAIAVKSGRMGYGTGTVQRHVLADVEFQCGNGRLVAVVGMNGSGKSTLLRSLSGLLPMLGGQVLLYGRDLGYLSIRERAMAAAVVLTERPAGFNLRVWDVVATGQMPYTNAFHRLEERHVSAIQRALERSGAHAYPHVPIGELSDGMFQKTMIARALAQETNLILLDEPLAFLDYRSRHELLILLRTLCREEGKCILFTTHDLDLVRRYCDDALIVANGGVISCPVAALENEPLFREIGGGFL